ncbi:LacI family DNA-binding transcriptional regulator [Amycolatopsis taiwanensis]|uniref:LacI family transcriptional regulator n=1 Tax=Amycolatopsis taiwanensis TaxID=342230 RepID=A0A9W6R983_9PSEU|nr:LacI family DNA-binding transcriptional regulator [Amycolatopsis taiwanensis]GLY71566.1 LacI family transcriptional regulator [Amycolatopsis taiwanensis]
MAVPSRGSSTATAADVARLAGVSPGVVSRLLNGDETLRVRDETKERVRRAAMQLDYTPNFAARALRKAKAGVIGLAVHDASNPIYSQIIAGAQAEATRAGYALMLADVDALATDHALFQRVVASGAIDGLLLQRAGTPADALVAKIAAERVPTVLLNDRSRGPIGSVAVDDYAAARLGVSHLIDLGHRDIGLLQVDGPRSRTSQRRKGWADALAAAALPAPAARVVGGGHTPEAGYRGMTALLTSSDRPTAVFVANSLSAVGALSAANDLGVGIPADLSVVGLHDLPLADFLHPKLSVVRLPLFEMGVRAVALMLEQLDDKPARHESIDDPGPVLVVRASSAAPGTR